MHFLSGSPSCPVKSGQVGAPRFTLMADDGSHFSNQFLTHWSRRTQSVQSPNLEELSKMHPSSLWYLSNAPRIRTTATSQAASAWVSACSMGEDGWSGCRDDGRSVSGGGLFSQYCSWYHNGLQLCYNLYIYNSNRFGTFPVSGFCASLGLGVAIIPRSHFCI